MTMDIERFQRLLLDPSRSKQDLMKMREHAIDKNAIAHIRAAENALDERFPGWGVVRTHGGGREPTYVEFNGQKVLCDSAKDGYIWLVERFLLNYPDLLEKDWSIFNRKQGVFFSRSLQELFKDYTSEVLPSMHSRLLNGWHAKTNISNAQKLDSLIHLSALAGLTMGKDWDWNDVSKENLGF
jgi:hypothetical protein